MSVAFPAIRPADRQFTPPSVPVAETRSESGLTFRRRRGSLAVDALLTLRFDARPVTDWKAIEAAWLASGSGMEGLVLPAEVWTPGAAPELPGLEWRFIPDRPPEKSEPRELIGRVNITVELRAVAV
jgi:hypothetical protein